VALIITDTVTLIILIITCYDICRNRRSKEINEPKKKQMNNIKGPATTGKEETLRLS